VAQVLLHVLHHSSTPAEAVGLPRLHATWRPTGTPVRVEREFSSALASSLMKRGHDVSFVAYPPLPRVRTEDDPAPEPAPDLSDARTSTRVMPDGLASGVANLVVFDAANDVFHAAADPRKGGDIAGV
jgi:gamma-glutamyltranspeptidase